MPTQHEEDRAWTAFQTELESTRDPRSALRAALVDLESRRIPDARHDGQARVAALAKASALLGRSHAMVDAVCADCGAKVATVCSLRAAGFGPGSHAIVEARGIIVWILVDAGYSSRQIMDGIGMSASSVAHLAKQRDRHPEWAAKAQRFAPMLQATP